ncbi:helix-turn-helix domain-containing protein [Bacillus swezeyi]|uniref:Helicase Helix-turn-helix domain-containing protein n=1 Tax=Bacillus swezeyi TaxID=1925020 RepID=A0A1R1QFW6_9BACI|nr:helix-turn-helix domain-containing protein [Bacillus swezeyi]MEC1260496.1 helix-turn-helix domain-containing protein [Bacillus swezeyi]MED2929599.1 helix-turn-helix domain-containing protein [Bacillus swezeyi]MED2963374.1 helix-turn-helix domain-containing protein [Bacillus swezeyi]MED2979194.1 helix-turn-helix domain-containing protein [Bacillus swezeyi]MED3073325.1 helix-turn-helix domain-containing protein [Bacillus swezeyi]
MSVYFFDAVVLDILSSMRGERSPSAVFHLLKGKRSSQTIQDAGLFAVSKYFGFSPSLSRDQLNSSVQKLKQKSFIAEKTGTDAYAVTESGQQELARCFSMHPWPKHFHGAYYQAAAKIMWGRMSLLLQVLSNRRYRERAYLPITKDYQIQNWVRHYLRSRNTEEMAARFHKELKERLSALNDDEQASVFVHSLTSARKAGFTFKQLAEKMHRDEWYIYALFWDVLHYFIQSAQNGESPILQTLIHDMSFQDALTQSTRKTLLLIKDGKSIDRIAEIRNLKTATIEDHIVEIAIREPAFSIERYVSKEEQKIIADYAKTNQTNKIRHIKEGLGDKYSYFKIRLALSKTVSRHG